MRTAIVQQNKNLIWRHLARLFTTARDANLSQQQRQAMMLQNNQYNTLTSIIRAQRSIRNNTTHYNTVTNQQHRYQHTQQQRQFSDRRPADFKENPFVIDIAKGNKTFKKVDASKPAPQEEIVAEFKAPKPTAKPEPVKPQQQQQQKVSAAAEQKPPSTATTAAGQTTKNTVVAEAANVAKATTTTAEKTTQQQTTSNIAKSVDAAKSTTTTNNNNNQPTKDQLDAAAQKPIKKKKRFIGLPGMRFVLIGCIVTWFGALLTDDYNQEVLQKYGSGDMDFIMAQFTKAAKRGAFILRELGQKAYDKYQQYSANSNNNPENNSNSNNNNNNNNSSFIKPTSTPPAAAAGAVDIDILNADEVQPITPKTQQQQQQQVEENDAMAKFKHILATGSAHSQMAFVRLQDALGDVMVKIEDMIAGMQKRSDDKKAEDAEKLKNLPTTTAPVTTTQSFSGKANSIKPVVREDINDVKVEDPDAAEIAKYKRKPLGVDDNNNPIQPEQQQQPEEEKQQQQQAQDSSSSAVQSATATTTSDNNNNNDDDDDLDAFMAKLDAEQKARQEQMLKEIAEEEAKIAAALAQKIEETSNSMKDDLVEQQSQPVDIENVNAVVIDGDAVKEEENNNNTTITTLDNNNNNNNDDDNAKLQEQMIAEYSNTIDGEYINQLEVNEIDASYQNTVDFELKQHLDSLEQEQELEQEQHDLTIETSTTEETVQHDTTTTTEQQEQEQQQQLDVIVLDDEMNIVDTIVVDPVEITDDISQDIPIAADADQIALSDNIIAETEKQQEEQEKQEETIIPTPVDPMDLIDETPPPLALPSTQMLQDAQQNDENLAHRGVDAVRSTELQHNAEITIGTDPENPDNTIISLKYEEETPESIARKQREAEFVAKLSELENISPEQQVAEQKKHKPMVISDYATPSLQTKLKTAEELEAEQREIARADAERKKEHHIVIDPTENTTKTIESLVDFKKNTQFRLPPDLQAELHRITSFLTSQPARNAWSDAQTEAAQEGYKILKQAEDEMKQLSLTLNQRLTDYQYEREDLLQQLHYKLVNYELGSDRLVMLLEKSDYNFFNECRELIMTYTQSALNAAISSSRVANAQQGVKYAAKLEAEVKRVHDALAQSFQLQHTTQLSQLKTDLYDKYNADLFQISLQHSKDMDSLTEQYDAIIDTMTEKVDYLHSAVVAQQRHAEQVELVSKIATALFEADRLLARGEPLVEPIRQLKQVSEYDPTLSNILSTIPPHVINDGVAPVYHIQQRFADLESAAHRATFMPPQPPPSQRIMVHILSRLFGMLTSKKHELTTVLPHTLIQTTDDGALTPDGQIKGATAIEQFNREQQPDEDNQYDFEKVQPYPTSISQYPVNDTFFNYIYIDQARLRRAGYHFDRGNLYEALAELNAIKNPHVITTLHPLVLQIKDRLEMDQTLEVLRAHSHALNNDIEKAQL